MSVIATGNTTENVGMRHLMFTVWYNETTGTF